MISMKIKLLMFDLDGTLVDSKADIVCQTNRALQTLGLKTFSDQEVTSNIGRGIHHLFTQLVGDSSPHIEELVETFKTYYF